MNVQITILVENTAGGPRLLAEHGLAYWIDSGHKSALFDTGEGIVLEGNAYKLGIALHQADAIVLSHGHYDHTGGLAEAMRHNARCEVFAHPTILAEKFARNDDGSAKEVGIPYTCESAIEEHDGQWARTERPTRVLDGLTATGPIPRVTDFEDTGGPFFLDRECRQPDPMTDDQALFFDTPQGTVVLLGCAHAGVINTLRYIRTLTGHRPIHTVLGGMHLVRASHERLSRTIEEFRRLGVERLGPAHCTGDAAVAALWNAFPSRCVPCHVGSRFEFELPSPNAQGGRESELSLRSLR